MSDRKQEIIYATLELASQYGLGAVSMQQIADCVGIRKASLYNHFSSRDAIVEAMYSFLRQNAKERSGSSYVDYNQLSDHLSLNDILTNAVMSYIKIIEDPQMYLFYAVIMSERSINKNAAEIMVKETETMINTTKALFYAIQAKNIAHFKDADMDAFSFAMAVHAIIDYQFDLKQTGVVCDWSLLKGYIKEFSDVYSIK